MMNNKEIKEILINTENYLSYLDKLLNELEIKKVVRNGKIVKKKECNGNLKWDNKQRRCVPMSPIEKLNRKRGAKRASIKRKSKRNTINKKREKSLKKRQITNL